MLEKYRYKIPFYLYCKILCCGLDNANNLLHFNKTRKINVINSGLPNIFTILLESRTNISNYLCRYCGMQYLN